MDSQEHLNQEEQHEVILKIDFHNVMLFFLLILLLNIDHFLFKKKEFFARTTFESHLVLQLNLKLVKKSANRYSANNSFSYR